MKHLFHSVYRDQTLPKICYVWTLFICVLTFFESPCITTLSSSGMCGIHGPLIYQAQKEHTVCGATGISQDNLPTKKAPLKSQEIQSVPLLQPPPQVPFPAPHFPTPPVSMPPLLALSTPAPFLSAPSCLAPFPAPVHPEISRPTPSRLELSPPTPPYQWETHFQTLETD